MKKFSQMLLLAILCVMVISACSGNNEGNNADPGVIENPDNNNVPGNSEQPGNAEEPGKSEQPGDAEEPTEKTGDSENSDGVVETEVDNMIAQIMEKVEQRPTMELEADMVEDMYYLNPDLLEDYSIHLPMFNISTNEFAILKAKDAKFIPTIEEAIKQRATDVQKSFEQYLPDQYENAKNYKLVTNGNYVLFVIDEAAIADAIVEIFNNFFTDK